MVERNLLLAAPLEKIKPINIQKNSGYTSLTRRKKTFDIIWKRRG